MKQLLCALAGLALGLAMLSGCSDTKGKVEKPSVIMEKPPATGPIGVEAGGKGAAQRLEKPKGK